MSAAPFSILVNIEIVKYYQRYYLKREILYITTVLSRELQYGIPIEYIEHIA